jgi:hypothetical protein
MNRTILKSNSAFVAIGQSPSWTTGNDSARLFSLVQNCNFSVSNERQKLKQIGNKSYAVNDLVRAPNVELSFDYYLSPYINNELAMNFQQKTADNMGAFINMKNTNNNFYIVIDPEDLRDAFDQPKNPIITNTSYSGFNVLSFGNCYLNKYSVNFSLNEIPTVSVGFEASNMKFDVLTGNSITIPAINSMVGNSVNAGSLNLSGFYSSLTGNFITGLSNGKTEYNPPVVVPSYCTFSLQNLQVGGVSLSAQSKPILQSLSLNFDLPRTPLYGLGSNYVYNRKLEYPINGSVSLSAQVSGFSSGFLSGMLYNESGYNFDISFSEPSKFATGFYSITNARLDNFNYSMAVNDVLNFTAEFSVETNDSAGFLIDRKTVKNPLLWSAISNLWSGINVNWLSLE